MRAGRCREASTRFPPPQPVWLSKYAVLLGRAQTGGRTGHTSALRVQGRLVAEVFAQVVGRLADFAPPGRKTRMSPDLGAPRYALRVVAALRGLVQRGGPAPDGAG